MIQERMFTSRFSRLVAVGALVGSAALATVSFVGSASATVTGIKCGKLTGTITGNVTLSKYSGNTGGASQPMPATSLASGGTIKWVNGKTTTITLSASNNETDPGETQQCAAGSSEYEAKGKVTADTTGSAVVGGKVKAEACLDAAGNISLEPGTKASIK
jgi:hypothetical protein